MNTNFQTFHQMGSAISDFVKQATGRENVQNIEMDHVTVAQNHVYDEVDVSGRVVQFNAGVAGLAFEKLLVQIKPVQAGSGDPSPDNIRPITGWTMVNLYQAGQNLEDARVFRFPFPSEAGVVYGGSLDAVSGVLIVDRAEVDLGALRWTYTSNVFVSNQFGANAPKTNALLACESYKWNSTENLVPANMSDFEISASPYFNKYTIWIKDSRYDDANTFKTAVSGVQLVYELTEPITYQLTPQQITTLLGQNNIWADTGDIEVKFTNLKELY